MSDSGLLYGDKAVQDYCHILAFCFFLASVDAIVGIPFGRHLWIALICFVVATFFYLFGIAWPRIRRRLWRKHELDILWKAGEFPYHYEYPGPPGGKNLQYRVRVVNNTGHNLNNVRVTLEKLTPQVLTTVPCSLKLMHDNKWPYPTSFFLPPHGGRFVDLMLQWPNCTIFWILHTVTEVVAWQTGVPAQGYYMTIKVESDDSDSTCRDFELVDNGTVWELKNRGIVKCRD